MNLVVIHCLQSAIESLWALNYQIPHNLDSEFGGMLELWKKNRVSPTISYSTFLLG